MVHILRNTFSLSPQRGRHGPEPLGHIDQQILHARDLRLLAAYAYLRTALAACGFLTLITKHFIFHDALSSAKSS